MPLIVYLDETGDHTLEIVDKNYPVFGLVMVICEVTAYTDVIVPQVYRLKMDFFGHENVVLHSYDIRKQKGAYAFLANADRRSAFYGRINDLMGGEHYDLIAAMIRKQQHKDRYGEAAANPYELAMRYALERLLPRLEAEGQEEVQILAESRGKNEDDALQLSFYKTVNEGTYFVSAERFGKVKFRLSFHAKEANLVGMQIADLAAYPIARHVLDATKPNPAYEIVKRRFYQGPGRVYGLKIFP